MKSYMNEIAEVDKKFINFNEERSNQLDLLDIELYKDIAEVDVDFRNKINAVIKKRQ